MRDVPCLVAPENLKALSKGTAKLTPQSFERVLTMIQQFFPDFVLYEEEVVATPKPKRPKVRPTVVPGPAPGPARILLPPSPPPPAPLPPFPESWRSDLPKQKPRPEAHRPGRKEDDGLNIGVLMMFIGVVGFVFWKVLGHLSQTTSWVPMMKSWGYHRGVLQRWTRIFFSR